jgi:hypothetical protein
MSSIPSNNDDFADLIFEPKRSVQPSLEIASKRDPDRHAENLQLSEEQRLPIDTVDRQIDEVRRRKLLSQIDLSGHPKTSKWLEDADNASVAIDDVDVLKGLEEMTREPDKGFWNNAARGGLDRVNTLTGNLLEFVGNSADSFEDYMVSLGLPNPGFVFDDDGISFSRDIPTEKTDLGYLGRAISEGKGYDYQPRFTWNKLKGDVTPKNLAGYVAEQGVQSLPDMLAALYTLPAYIASRTEEIAEERVKNDLRSEVEAGDLAASIVPATAVALIERLGAKITFGRGKTVGIKGIAKATGFAGAVEGATEFIQEGVEYLGETVGTEKEVSYSEMVDRQFAGLVAGTGIGGTIRGSTATVEAIGNRTQKNMANKGQSASEQETIENIITYAQSSATSERAESRFEAFVASLGGREILIPEEIAAQTVLKDQVKGLGGDISIPLDKFATLTKDEEFMSLVRPHIRLSENSLSQNEIESEDLALKELLKRAQESQETLSEADKVFDRVKEQLTATGLQSESTARDSAQIYPAAAAVYVEKAKKMGKDLTIEEAFEMMGFQVRSEEITEPTLSQSQKFGTLTEDRIIEETGETVTITQDAQKLWDQAQERRSVVERLRGCVNA